jgi:hypothetical protein
MIHVTSYMEICGGYRSGQMNSFFLNKIFKNASVNDDKSLRWCILTMVIELRVVTD